MNHDIRKAPSPISANRAAGKSELGTATPRAEMEHWLTRIDATVPGVICSFKLRADGTACMPYASSSLFDLYGLHPESVRDDSSPIFALIDSEDHGHVNETIAFSAREMTPWRAEYRIRHPEKGERWIEGHSMPQRESDGSVIWYGYLQDITERRQMESALRESERLYRAIGESIDYGIWICAPDGANIYASDSFLKLVGMTQEECSNDGWGRVLHPDDAERTIAAWKACVQAGNIWDIEHRFRGVDGSWHDVLARGVPVRNEHGAITHWAGINLDISRQKKTEQLLRTSEADLRRAQIVAQTGSWRLNVLRDELIWSDENHCIFGIPKGEPLSYETFLSTVHPQDKAMVDAAWRAALQGTPYDVEHRIVLGGKTKWVRERAELEWDTDGSLLGAFGSTQEITLLKRAEAALSASESRFRLAMEAVAGVVYDWDRQTGLTYWSSGLSRILGVTHVDSKSSRRWWRKNLHPEDRISVCSEIQRSRRMRPDQYELEYRLRHQNGHWVYVSDRAQILRDEAGKITRLVGSLTDISERKRAEAALLRMNDHLEEKVSQRTAEAEARAFALLESERFARTTIDALDSALCVLDTNGSIVAVNKSWREFAVANGGDVDHLCEGSNYLATCDEAAESFPVAATVASAIRDAIAGLRRTFAMEYDCHSPDERRWFVMKLSCFPDNGPLRLVIQHENITARKLAEQDQVASASRLKRLAAHLESVREEQSATIAREVHDELGGTLTMVKLGLATYAARLPDSAVQKDTLGQILEQVDAALQTVKRISSDLRPATLDALGLVATIRWYAAQFTQMTGLAIELHLPEFVRLSRRRSMATFRIIQEALTNVAKHAEASKVSISMQKSKGMLVIKISDNGVGMADGWQLKKDSFGLIGMRERAQYLDGVLSIIATPKKETTLLLQIPLAPPSEEK